MDVSSSTGVQQAIISGIRSSVLAGLEIATEDAGEVSMQYKMQQGRLKLGSPSLIDSTESANEILEEEEKARDGSDKKKCNGIDKNKQQNKLLDDCVHRLDTTKGSRQYKDFGEQLSRLQNKCQLTYFENQNLKSTGLEKETLYNGQTLEEVILGAVDEGFDEVTEKDNALQYAYELNDLDTQSLESQIKKTEEYVEHLSEKSDQTSEQQIEGLREHIVDLKNEVEFKKVFSGNIKKARENLQKTHGAEIKDGYNLIKKASDLFKKRADMAGKSFTATDFAKMYMDLLQLNTPIDVLKRFINETGKNDIKKLTGKLVELLGRDIDSANPSRSTAHLMAVRDLLFNVEVCGQVYTSVGNVYDKIKMMFNQPNGEGAVKN